MASNLKSLLNKKTWKGEEIGRAVLLNLFNDFAQADDPDHQPLFSLEDLRRMEASLVGKPKEIEAYNSYIGLYNGLAGESDRSEAIAQQAYNGYYRLLNFLNNALQAERALKMLQDFPLVMTKKQYEDALAKVEKKQRGYCSSYLDVFFDALTYYLGEIEGTKPKVPKKLKDAFEALKKEPFTNNHIIGLINSVYGLGYYELSNGLRSDQMPRDEWIKALEEEYLKNHKYVVDGEVQGYKETVRHFSMKRTVEELRQIYKEGAISPSKEKSLAEWHKATEPPEGLTKWDILTGSYDMKDTYRGLEAEAGGKELEYFNMFKADFPDVYQAIKEDMDKQAVLKPFAKLQPEQYTDELISWGELADANLYYYPSLAKAKGRDILDNLEENKRERVFLNGISIIQEDTILKNRLDENGYYKEVVSPLYDLFISIEKLYENSKEEIEAAREHLLKPSIKEMNAYNSIIELLGKTFKLPEIEQMKQARIQNIYDLVEKLNDMAATLFNDLIGTDEQIKEKQAIIKELFPLIELEKLQTSEANIRALEKQFQDLSSVNLSELHYYVLLLMKEGEGAAD